MTPEDHKKKGMTLFVLGLLGIVVCQLLAPIAWFMGIQYVRGCRAEEIEPDPWGQIGRILGIVGTVLLLLTVASVLSVLALEAIIFWYLL